MTKHSIVPSGVRMKIKRPNNPFYKPEEEEDLDLVPGHEDSPSKTGGPLSSFQLGTIKTDSVPPSQPDLRTDELLLDYARSKAAVE